jgi:protocatechuate 3,4-dioxygenase beta subunit
MRQSRRWHAVACAVVAGFASLLITVAGQAASPQAAAKKENLVGPFQGTVVDVAGKPVAGAAVWLVGGLQDDPQIVAETTSDQKGRFQIGKQPWKLLASPEHAIPTMLTARDSSGRIGGSVYYGERQRGDGSSPREFQIKLQNVRDCRVRLTDSAGKPIVGAKIRPTQWATDWSQEEQMQHLIFLPTRLVNEMATETDADGRFTVRRLPTVGRISVSIGAAGFGRPIATWKLDAPASIQIGRVGSLRGSLVCGHDPKAAAGVKLRLHTFFPGAVDGDVYFHYIANGVTTPNGSFQFADVPPGKYDVSSQLSNTSPYYQDGIGPVEVKSGEVATASFSLKQAMKLQGKIVDGETGKGVPGINVMVYLNRPHFRGDSARSVTTDAQGTFTFFSRPGAGFIQIWNIPDQYLTPPSQQRNIEITADTTLETVRLQRAKGLQGIVVDKAGKPVAGARIVCVSVNMGDNFSPDRDLRADNDGTFLIKRATPKTRLNIRARNDRAVSEPVSVMVGTSQGPIRLVVDEKMSCTIKGRVVDDEGRPLPDAKIELIMSLWFGDHGTSFRCDTAKTDAAGKFRIGGLWAGDSYELHVSAKDCETRGTQCLAGTVGGTSDFGKIALPSIGGVVEGRMLDSSGKPLAGVRVFNSGDAPQPIETRSDADGRFRLAGLRKGTVYVSAEQKGYRFSGAKTTSGATNVVVTMLRSDEPTPKWSVPTPPADEAQQKRIATRKLLELLAAATDDGIKGRARSRLATLDAQEKADREKHPPATKPSQPPPSKQNDIYSVAEEDADEALSMLPQDPSQAYQQLKGLAERFAASDREKALWFTSEAIVRARTLDDPQRVLSLGELAALASRLGNREGGAKLAREAADMAAKWPATEQRQWQVSALANTVAAVDLSIALKIAEKIDKQQRSHCLGEIAMRLDDVSQIETILKDCDGWYAGRARGRVAFRIAANRPADALKLIEGLPPDGGRDELTKAAAFGWLATAIAAKDPKLAHELIDRAFAIWLHLSDPTQYLAGERAALPAMLAVHAKMAGYADMESVINRVLATRLTMKNTWGPVAVQESSVATALFLALADPPLAKEMLQAVEPNCETLGAGCCGIGVRDWLKAWALVDPLHTVELAARHAAAAKDENARKSAWYAAEEVLDLWKVERGEVLKRLAQDYINLFSPYER